MKLKLIATLATILCYSNAQGLVEVGDGSFQFSSQQKITAESLFGPNVAPEISIQGLPVFGNWHDQCATLSILKALRTNTESNNPMDLEVLSALFDHSNETLAVPQPSNSSNPILSQINPNLQTRLCNYLYKTIGKSRVAHELLLMYLASLAHDEGIMQACARNPKLAHLCQLLHKGRGAKIFDKTVCPNSADPTIIFCTTGGTHYYNDLFNEDGVKENPTLDPHLKKDLRTMFSTEELNRESLDMMIVFLQEAQEEGHKVLHVILAHVTCSALNRAAQIGGQSLLKITIYDPYVDRTRVTPFNVQCAENFVDHLMYLLAQMTWAKTYSNELVDEQPFIQTSEQKISQLQDPNNAALTAAKIEFLANHYLNTLDPQPVEPEGLHLPTIGKGPRRKLPR